MKREKIHCVIWTHGITIHLHRPNSDTHELLADIDNKPPYVWKEVTNFMYSTKVICTSFRELSLESGTVTDHCSNCSSVTDLETWCTYKDTHSGAKP